MKSRDEELVSYIDEFNDSFSNSKVFRSSSLVLNVLEYEDYKGWFDKKDGKLIPNKTNFRDYMSALQLRYIVIGEVRPIKNEKILSIKVLDNNAEEIQPDYFKYILTGPVPKFGLWLDKILDEISYYQSQEFERFKPGLFVSEINKGNHECGYQLSDMRNSVGELLFTNDIIKSSVFIDFFNIRHDHVKQDKDGFPVRIVNRLSRENGLLVVKGEVFLERQFATNCYSVFLKRFHTKGLKEKEKSNYMDAMENIYKDTIQPFVSKIIVNQ
ncbi:MAG: hypothetical protein ABJG47_13945 [Ekhidna sp.]